MADPAALPTAPPASEGVPPAGAGPLARFTRAAEAPQAPPAAASSPSAPPAAAPAGPPSGAPPANRPQRSRSEKPKSMRQKNRDEDSRVDKELRAERELREEFNRREHVPVPNLRQKSDELEAEVAAALGGMSLETIVEGDMKSASQRLENESRHRAQVVNIHGDDVFFALGGKNQGVASARSFATPPNAGDMLDVIVTGLNTDDNLYLLAIPGGSLVAGGGDWTDVAEGSLVEAKVSGANTGGLECQVGTTRAFIPASQVGLYRTENLPDYIGQKLVCVVTQSDQARGNLVLSRRAVLEREKEESKKQLMAELEVGQMREGTVRKIHDFGAFVDLGGVDGLIHVSQLSWERVKHPSEVVQEGQKVRVRVERIDEATGKLSLSLKNPEEHPWTGIEQKFPVGQTVKGPVSRIAQFGAFVKLAPGVEGLIHISELAHHRVYKVENVVKEGDEVECKVLTVDADAQRIGLSLKATLAKPEKAADKDKDKPEVEEPRREPAIAKRPGPLRGGTAKKSGGEQFGLQW